MRLLVFIPTYNERDNISRLVHRLLSEYGDVDLLVVDDASTDSTVEELQRYLIIPTRFKIICKDNRYHLRDSFMLAFDYFNQFYNTHFYDYLVVLDAGDSLHFEEIYQRIKPGWDLIVGYRDFSCLRKRNWWRALLSRVGTLLFNTVHFTRFKDTTVGLRAYSRDLVRRTDWSKIRSRRFGVQQDLLSYFRRMKILEVPITYDYGTSSLRLNTLLDSLKNMARKVFYRPRVYDKEG